MPLADHEAEVAEKDTEIAALKTQVDELAGSKKELDALKQAQADAELAARQATLRTFAENYGLDVEKGPIADAITALDYGTVIAAAAEKPDPQPKTAAVRPMADIIVDEPYGGILGKTK